jgi:hypothetical protein
MSTIKIKVGTLTLTESRDENLPQEFAAWHQTVRIAPGTYDVFAYLEHMYGPSYHVQSLSAQCEGITISSNFRAHLMGVWGKSDNNCNGKAATANVHLPTYGTVGTPVPLLAQATLCDALVRYEWDPREADPLARVGKMWRLKWNRARKPIVLERRRGGGLCLAAFEDTRRFRVNDAELSSSELDDLDVMFLGSSVHHHDYLAIHQSCEGHSFKEGKRCRVTRVA